jgi:spore photoproduct lyase
LKIKHLFIHRDVADSKIVTDVTSRLHVSAQIVDRPADVYSFVSEATDPVQKGKETLFLTQNMGPFVRECPGTRTYTCCGYHILHIGTFCSMDCAYCILQAYFHPPVLQFFVNHDDLFSQLDDFLAQPKIQRIGTGEFTDSLIWESFSDLSARLIQRFSIQSRSVLELKTKTTAIQKLKALDHQKKTILAWSLNTDRVIAEQERQTTPLMSRLRAAAECESLGYPLAFHFDPIVVYDGCEAEYRQVIQSLFSHISPQNIVWISLGTFRFMPDLKAIIQNRFPESNMIYGEFITGLDGKMRYFKPIRLKIFQKLAGWIKEIAPDVLVYFCMEDDEIWEKTLGIIPSALGGLNRMLDESAAIHCGLTVSPNSEG